jgi:hypothetical protein
MMTLLFGLFVLLFSMSTLKKEQAEAIRKSTEEKFAHPKDEDKKPEIDPAKELTEQIETLKAAALAQNEELEKLKTEKAEAAKAAAEKSAALETEKRELENKIADLKSAAKKKQNSKDDSAVMIAALEEKKEKLEEKTRRLEEQKKQLEDENQSLKSDAKRETASVNKAAEMQQQLEASETARRDLEQQVEDLKKKAETPADNGSMHQQSFIAFFINWSTKDHDIDMTIRDPNGKSFDFKKRKYPGQPGFFALDTRRGPGAELWQSDRLIPGTYTATYMFYNQYGNPNPATVSGTIFTPKGSTEVPAVEMTMDKKRKVTVTFDVDKDGNVKMLGSK